jgi:hypothetical protein
LNFEHLYKNLNHKTFSKFKIYTDYVKKNNQIKKQKLKLGAISFEIIETFVNKIKIYENLEIKFIRQDTSFNDSLKFKNRLKNLE